MKDSTFKQLLKKYENGSASAAERYVVERWYASFDETARDEAEWLDGTEKARIREQIWKATQARGIGRQPRTLSKLAKVAAALLVAVSASLLLWRAGRDDTEAHKVADLAATIPMQLVSTAGRQVKHVLLPDSSQVWLNAHSSIAIPQNYGTANRRVRLAGEAFFDIKPDSLHPFVVASQSITISVLGTSFNVRAYDTLEEIQVAVSTGRVSVADSSLGVLAQLAVDDNLVYNRHSGSVNVVKVDALLGSTWREGRIVFENERFEVLAQGFYNLFGVALHTDDKEVAALRYSLVLHHGMSEEEAIKMICKVVSKQYRKEGNGQVVIY